MDRRAILLIVPALLLSSCVSETSVSSSSSSSSAPNNKRVYDASKTSSEERNAYSLTSSMSGTMNYSIDMSGIVQDVTVFELAIDDLLMDTSIKANGLNSNRVNSFQTMYETSGYLSGSSRRGLQTTSLSTPLDQKEFIRNGREYVDNTGIDWDAVYSMLEMDLPDAALIDGINEKSYREVITNEDTLALYQSNYRSYTAYFYPEEVSESDLALLDDGRVSLDYEISEREITLLVVQFLTAMELSQDTVVLYTMLTYGALDVESCDLTYIYSADSAELDCSVHMTIDPKTGDYADVADLPMRLDVDLEVTGRVDFLDEVDIDYPSDLSSYVERVVELPDSGSSEDSSNE